MPLGAPPSRSLDPFSAGIAPGTATLFDAYLGQPRTGKTNPLAGRNVTTWNMDEAYEGQALALRDTVIDWLWTANQTFYTEWCLPWKPVDDIYVEWRVWEANAHILGQNPHQATARLISQRRHTRRAALMRRGIGFQIEHDWAKTALGRESILIGMGQIARSYQETANAEVIRALLHASHWYQQYVRDNGQVRRLDHLDYLRHQRDYFAYFQKTKNGPELWDSATDAEANAYYGQFDTIIMPERMYNYITMVPPEKTDYYMRGPKGPAAIDGKGGWTMPAPKIQDSKEPSRWLAQKRVYQARAYHVEGTEPVELLAKPVQMGEYNQMDDRHCKYDDGCYVSKERDIMIYDEDRDRYSVITLKAALENCQLFDANGALIPLQTPEGGQATPDMARDFLTRVLPDGSIAPVEFLGDIGDLFIDVNMLDKMAETMLCRMYRGNPAARAAAESAQDALKLAEKLRPFLGQNAILDNPQALKVLYGSGVGASSSSSADTTELPASFNETLILLGNSIVTDSLVQRRLAAEINKATTLADLRSNVAPFLERHAVGDRDQGYKFEKPEQVREWFGKQLDQIASKLGATESKEGRFPQSAAEMGLFQEVSSPQDEYGYDEPVYMGSRFQSQPVGTIYGFGRNDEGVERMKQARGMGRDQTFSVQGVNNTGKDNMFNEHLKAIGASGMSSLKKKVAATLLAEPFNKKSLESFIVNNILFPMNFLILRPHGTWRGRTCIKMLGGGAAGNMYLAHGSAEVGHDAQRMISVLHSVAYMAAIVQNAQHVYAAPNLYIDRYMGGLGMRFFNPASYQRRSAEHSEESIVVVAVPYLEREFPNPLDIAGRHYTDYDSGLIDLKNNNELHYSTAYRYNNEYHFFSRSNQQDELSQPTVLPGDVHMNRICWSGAQFNYNRLSGKFDYYEYNTSGWGELVYPGCGRVRNGSDMYLDPQKMSSIATAV